LQLTQYGLDGFGTRSLSDLHGRDMGVSSDVSIRRCRSRCRKGRVGCRSRIVLILMMMMMMMRQWGSTKVTGIRSASSINGSRKGGDSRDGSTTTTIIASTSNAYHGTS
jgi:hypothetical protein